MTRIFERVVDIISWAFLSVLCVFLVVEFLVRQIAAVGVAPGFVYWYSLFGGIVLIGAISIGLVRCRAWLIFPVSTLIVGWLANLAGLDVEYMFINFLGQPLFLDLLLVTALFSRCSEGVIKNHLPIVLATIPALLLENRLGPALVTSWVGIGLVTVLVKIHGVRGRPVALGAATWGSLVSVGGLLGLNTQEMLAAMLLVGTVKVARSPIPWPPSTDSSRAVLVAAGGALMLFSGVSLVALFAEHRAVAVQLATRPPAEAVSQPEALMPPQQVVGATPLQWVELDASNLDRAKYHDASVEWGRRRIYLLFGSDTHGKDADNQVRRFDLAKLQFQEDQPASPPWLMARSFRTGLYVPTLRGSGQRPVSMHAYDQLAWLPSEGCMAMLGVPLHHLPTLGLPDRPQRPRLWCYDPEKQSWRVLTDSGGATPRLFSGALVSAGDAGLYAFGHLPTERGLLPIGGEGQFPRGGLYHWIPREGSWEAVDPGFVVGSQIVAEWEPASRRIVVLDEGGRRVTLVEPGAGAVTPLEVGADCIQQESYPPLTAVASLPGKVHFLVRRGKQTALCEVDVEGGRVRLLRPIDMSLPMNFHLHYVPEWHGLLMFQPSRTRPGRRGAWFMKLL